MSSCDSIIIPTVRFGNSNSTVDMIIVVTQLLQLTKATFGGVVSHMYLLDVGREAVEDAQQQVGHYLTEGEN